MVTKDSKKCPCCGKTKVPSDFGINNRRHDGLATYCIECTREKHAAIRRAARIALLDFLGGKCVRCGFADWRALQIDHVNGGGAADRQKGRAQSHIDRRVRANPTLFQVLCANCNSIKRVDEGEHTGSRQYVRIIRNERIVGPRRIPAKAQSYSKARTEAAKQRENELAALIAVRRPVQRSPQPLRGYWSRWYEKCLGCQETDRQHVSDGLCWRCNKQAKGLNRRPSVFDDPAQYVVEAAPES